MNLGTQRRGGFPSPPRASFSYPNPDWRGQHKGCTLQFQVLLE